MSTSGAKNFNAEPYPYHTELDLRIDNITNLGLGIGRHNGWVIMVPNVAIGERIRCRIFRNHSNYSEADLVEITEPAAERIEPKCPLFGICGGCQYQHLNYENQLRLKRQQVRELLQKLAKIDVDVAPTIGAEPTYHYRSKLTPHFAKNVQKIGFLKAGSRHQIVDVEQCALATHSINDRFKKLRLEIRRKTFKKGGTLLLREGVDSVETDPKKIVIQSIGDCIFHTYAGEFFQNNPHILPTFTDYIISEAAGDGINFLLDIYCGVGVFGICGSQKFQSVTGIEINERAIELAKKNAAINEINNISFTIGSAENIFAKRLPDNTQTAAIIDPPRKGCDPLFLKQLVNFLPKKIVYVSCSPDTQARDLRFLSTHYAVRRVQPFDLFPQTRHIENIVTLSACN
ncbi:MAG: class I SAM-dependent RNA methyltransferase [Puniceicoccales bacterium]|jgi:23S rRNA (uracil1939-C5)-methyltransferase/tRNA (uracil-5-)-methyltransferase|nr:class I SAM-dependent RNA methyltransferase [Puniceicoccales bacterium]